ncbi:MAG: leucine-rich repeat domain-containing protein [Odoribacteraceae bacterium]|jgi:hypothetical protein|nr:leucine-rich repeat domain-containing protein [Odoribacteraceae bacterium]
MKTRILILGMLLLTNMATGFAQSGTCGENLTWTLSEDEKTLKISGTGAMRDYLFILNTSPWDSYRSSITTVEIGDGVTSIGDWAFSACSSLTSITIPDGVTSIGDGAFAVCRSLTSIAIPDGVTSIGKQAFYDCDRLTAIRVENGNVNYSSEAGILFNKDKTTLVCCPGGTTGNYTIPDGVTSIEDWAFSGCRRLTSITIPDGVTRIGKDAFTDCLSLTSIAIPDGVKSIEDKAFAGCLSLTSITIPDGVTNIGVSAFYDCRSLTSVTNLNLTPQKVSSDVFSNVKLRKATLYVPAASRAAYKAADVWKNFGSIKAYVP